MIDDEHSNEGPMRTSTRIGIPASCGEKPVNIRATPGRLVVITSLQYVQRSGAVSGDDLCDGHAVHPLDLF